MVPGSLNCIEAERAKREAINREHKLNNGVSISFSKSAINFLILFLRLVCLSVLKINGVSQEKIN